MSAAGAETPTIRPGRWSTIRLVAGRELRGRLRRRGFRIGTVVLVIGVLALGLGARVLGGDDEPTRVAVVGGGDSPVAAQVRGLADATGEEVEVVDVADRAAGEVQVRDGDVAALVVPDDTTIVWRATEDDALSAVLRAALTSATVEERAADAGVDPAVVQRLLVGPDITVDVLEPDDEVDPTRLLAGFAAAILLMVTIATYGNYVMMGVVEEKSTAVVEVLLGQIGPRDLLTGKVLGLGTVALLQVGAVVAAAAVAIPLSGRSVPLEVVATLPTTLVFFVLGFALYATLYGLAGSLVSRMEDAAQAALPLTVVLTGSYAVVFANGTNPDSSLTTWLSLLPPSAPLLMPLRVAQGAAPPWQVGLSIVLLVASVWGLLVLGGKVYSRTVLQRGSRIRWRDALRASTRPR